MRNCIPLAKALGDERAAYLARYHMNNEDVRAEVIEAYGGVCVCCSESLPEVLTIDHIYGDGYTESRSRRKRLHVILWQEGYPRDRYQLLCMNCNRAKAQKAKCPHQTKAHVYPSAQATA